MIKRSSFTKKLISIFLFGNILFFVFPWGAFHNHANTNWEIFKNKKSKENSNLIAYSAPCPFCSHQFDKTYFMDSQIFELSTHILISPNRLISINPVFSFIHYSSLRGPPIG